MTRRWLRALAAGLIGVLLFAQLSVAAYACPGLGSADAPAVMADCDDMLGSMDHAAANLCAEHCKQGQQSDQAPTLPVPAPLFIALYPVVAPPPGRAPPRPPAATLNALASAWPPHAILHCVFRI